MHNMHQNGKTKAAGGATTMTLATHRIQDTAHSSQEAGAGGISQCVDEVRRINFGALRELVSRIRDV